MSSGKLIREQDRLFEKYPESDAYKALVANRERDRSSSENEGEDAFGELLKTAPCRNSMNHFVFVINGDLPLIATTLGQALADAEPMNIIRTLLERGADPNVVQYENDETPCSAEQLIASLKKLHSVERSALVAEMTSGNVLDKNYYKNAQKTLKDFAKAQGAFVDGAVV